MWVQCKQCGFWSSEDEPPKACPDCGAHKSFHSPENNPFEPGLVYPKPEPKGKDKHK